MEKPGCRHGNDLTLGGLTVTTTQQKYGQVGQGRDTMVTTVHNDMKTLTLKTKQQKQQ